MDPIPLNIDWSKYERRLADERRLRRTYHFPPIGKNPLTGRRRCRVCQKDIVGRGINYCSQPCRERAWFCLSTSWQRFRLFERDKGVCSYCGTDTERLRKRLEKMPGYHRWAPEAERNKYYDVLRRWDINFDLGYAGGHLWETHHKVAISEGGGGPITVDDLATACWKCHPKLTGELRRRLNRAKGVKKP